MVVKEVAILGAGAMGSGIAQVAAQAGFGVRLQDVREEALAKARAGMEKSLQRFAEKGKVRPEEVKASLGRVAAFTSLEEAVAGADLVIEAVPEDLELKRAVFKKLGDICGAEVLLASNTSSLPIAALAAVTRYPERVLGLHFMNPVPLMEGVEVIPSLLTAPAVLEETMEFVRRLGKTPVKALDYAGFIASRVLDVMLNEAVFCVMDGNEPAEIDRAMKACCNFPMGPLELIDLVGADILLHAMECLEAEFGDKYRPAPLLRQMVRAGRLGRKAGHGFYSYGG